MALAGVLRVLAFYRRLDLLRLNLIGLNFSQVRSCPVGHGFATASERVSGGCSRLESWSAGMFRGAMIAGSPQQTLGEATRSVGGCALDPWTDGETDPGEEFHQEMLARYGQDWPRKMREDLRFDPDAEAEDVELPGPNAEFIMVRKVFLRLPFEVDKQFEQLGRRLGRGPSELVTEWIAERLARETEPPATRE
ncbi:ribbon-helix-helix domain-containing protein [Nocardia sp. R7R-8]|uniref:ribbon-helix-helix domain-containing protein n=1 Tax=Nocardia sp. R7R-8 TaxID=3459304 RepID=UPI00403D7CB1